MITPLWDCLDFDSQLCLFGFQRDNHDAHWMPGIKPDWTKATITARYADNSVTVDPSKVEVTVVKVMQATPSDVKHNRGVFNDRAG